MAERGYHGRFAPTDYTGMRSGKLVAIKRVGSRNSRPLWLCQCDCGRQSVANGFMQTKSCGCRVPKLPVVKPAGNFQHGHRGAAGSSKTPTYYSWASMRTRCTNPNDPSWRWYGALGVTCCDRWAKFKNFLQDMGECPQGMTLDRWPDPYGNYEPENCRWATPLQQSQNTRK